MWALIAATACSKYSLDINSIDCAIQAATAEGIARHCKHTTARQAGVYPVNRLQTGSDTSK